MDPNFLIQSIVGMLVITAPPDPAKLLFFNSVVAKQTIGRTQAAVQVALVVLVVLGGSAVAGKEVAELLGIDLNAFSVVGGLLVAGMGLEMLYGGQPSKTQGRDQIEDGPAEDSGLVMPLAIPLIAGPGSIVATVTISTSNPTQGMFAALIGAVSVAVLCFISFQWLGGLLARLSDTTTALLMRVGGLLLATIGTQMMLGGLKNFFAS